MQATAAGTFKVTMTPRSPGFAGMAGRREPAIAERVHHDALHDPLPA